MLTGWLPGWLWLKGRVGRVVGQVQQEGRGRVVLLHHGHCRAGERQCGMAGLSEVAVAAILMGLNPIRSKWLFPRRIPHEFSVALNVPHLRADMRLESSPYGSLLRLGVSQMPFSNHVSRISSCSHQLRHCCHRGWQSGHRTWVHGKRQPSVG